MAALHLLSSLALGAFLALTPPVLERATESGSGDVHDRARALEEAGTPNKAIDLLVAHLMRSAEDPLAHEILGELLLDTEENDRAAHHLDTAVTQYEAAGKARDASRVARKIGKADRYARRRDALFTSAVKNLLSAAEKLHKNGQPERARQVLERIAPLATGKERKRTESLLEEIGSADAEVDLDAAATEDGANASRPLVVVESERYIVEANLEPDLTQLVADTMDDIFGNPTSRSTSTATSARSRARRRRSASSQRTPEMIVGQYPGGAPVARSGRLVVAGREQGDLLRHARPFSGSLDEMLEHPVSRGEPPVHDHAGERHARPDLAQRGHVVLLRGLRSRWRTTACSGPTRPCTAYAASAPSCPRGASPSRT